jgi:hypothetical protein
MAPNETKQNAPPQGSTAVAEPEPQSKPQTQAEIDALNGGAATATKHEQQAAAMAIRENVRIGIVPRNLEEAFRLAQFIASSELVPKGYRGRPSDVVVAMQYGAELGLPPMAALHSIFVTNGRPALWGEGFLGVIISSKEYADHHSRFVVIREGKPVEVEYLAGTDLADDNTMAVCTFWRKNSSRPTTATFSVGQAKRANLWKKAGPWQEYPDRMLMHRAVGFAGRDAFPDILRGILLGEEAIDIPAEPAAPETKEVRRISETRADTPAVDGQIVESRAVAVPKVTEVTLDPAIVTDVQQFMGGYTVMLSNGMKVDTTETVDAVELEKFKGTSHKVRLHVAKADDGNLQLRSFAIAD